LATLQDVAKGCVMLFNSIKYCIYSKRHLCIVLQEIASNSKRNSHQNSHQLVTLSWIVLAITIWDWRDANAMNDPNDFRKSNLKLWAQLMKEIFPYGIPASATWTDLDSMGSVLTKIGSRPNSNHMFYPTGGGMDLSGASPFNEEPGCLALRTGGERVVEVVKPSALLFESFGSELEWAYFRIECEPMPLSGIYRKDELGNLGREELVLVSPGTYADRNAWDENEYDGEPLPESARLVIRFFGGKPFVIFAKGSIYNMANGQFDAYDARHAKVSAPKFKARIKEAAARG
jgi:serine/threonine-protein kinase